MGTTSDESRYTSLSVSLSKDEAVGQENLNHYKIKIQNIKIDNTNFDFCSYLLCLLLHKNELELCDDTNHEHILRWR